MAQTVYVPAANPPTGVINVSIVFRDDDASEVAMAVTLLHELFIEKPIEVTEYVTSKPIPVMVRVVGVLGRTPPGEYEDAYGTYRATVPA